MSMEIRIPQIILGESFAIITRDSKDDYRKQNIFKLLERVQDLVSHIKICTPPLDNKTIRMARSIIDEDNRIDWTDSIFVSHAITDRDARYVFTTDTDIQESEVIQAKINEREEGWSNLNIKDSVEENKLLRRKRRY